MKQHLKWYVWQQKAAEAWFDLSIDAPATGQRLNWSILCSRRRSNGNTPQLPPEFISSHCLHPSGVFGSLRLPSVGQNMTGPAAAGPCRPAADSTLCQWQREVRNGQASVTASAPALLRCKRGEFNGDSEPARWHFSPPGSRGAGGVEQLKVFIERARRNSGRLDELMMRRGNGRGQWGVFNKTGSQCQLCHVAAMLGKHISSYLELL